jgi:hypothetical protein
MKIKLSSIALVALILSPQAFAEKPGKAPPANPLIAYWNFDEIVENKVKDLSGNGHDGNVTGATLEEGKLGKAILFTATNKNFVDVPNSEQFNQPNKQFTVMAWVKPRSLNPKAAAGVINFAAGYAMQISKNKLTYSDSIWDFCEFGSYGQLEQDKWQHLAAVRNGDKVTLYIDGKEVGSRSVAGDIKPSKAKIIIGAQSAKAAYFDGWVDEVAIFGKALTSSAIKAKAQQGAGK